MRFPGFIGPSYQLQSVNVDAQRCVNLYAEMDESGAGNEGEVASLVGTPGLRLLTALPTGPVRGTYTDSRGTLWAVGGKVLYQVSPTWAAQAVGTLNTSLGPVSMSDNGLTLCLVDGPYGYAYQMTGLPVAASGTVTASTGPAANDTVTINGTVITFISGTLSGNQVETDSSASATMGRLLTFLQGSTDPNLTQCTYALDSNGPFPKLTITAKTAGSAGNLITLSRSSSALTLSGATLSGGWDPFQQITDTGFQGATQVSFMDGYFIFNKPGSQQFYLSGLSALTFNGLDVGTAEAGPDNLVGQLVAQEYLYLFSVSHLEVFSDTGNNSFPFERFQGTVTEIGCASAFSIAKIQNQIFWLGQDPLGRGIVYRMVGFQPQRISTHAIEHVIASLGDLSGARAYTYQQGGHAFYCLNLPGATTTWVFDVATNLWHERASLSQGQYQRHLADCHALAYGTNVAGDYSSGNLYALDPSVRTDNGSPIVWERTAPHVSKDLVRITHNSFLLDMETGVGLDGGVQGSDPQVMLSWSNDGGHTWSSERWASAGKRGAYRTRVQFRRLGQARDRVYRVRGSDPVRVTLLGAELDLLEAGS